MEKEIRNTILATQLSELNNRSRAYAAQIWQVPFAYFGLTGLILGSLVDRCPTLLGIALIISGMLGIVVLVHIFGNLQACKRAVLEIQSIERSCGLHVTAQWAPKLIVYPLIIAVVCMAVICLIMGIYILWPLIS